MASPKQIFLVALLLTIALGCHGSRIKTCKTNKDCPACRLGLGVPLCLNGLCTCFEMTMKDADVANGCKIESDCGKICGEGCSSYSCVGNRCFCAC